MQLSRAVLHAALCVGTVTLAPARAAASVVVPAAKAAVEGNSSGSFPFGCSFGVTSLRYQQVYLGAEVGTGTVTELRLRRDAQTGAPFGPTTIPGVTITLSSSTVAPDGLSATFAANVGPDVATVFSGNLTLSSASSSAVPRPFNLVVPLTAPFAFDGSSGANLLLDVTIPTCTNTTQFDLESSTDSVSRAFSSFSGAGSPTADVRDSLGLVTQFIFATDLLCGDGIVDAGEQCDDGNAVDGDCCSSSCHLEPSTTVCRSSTGVCDPAESCTGTSPTCPADVFQPDADGDGVCDPIDDCPAVADPVQSDLDSDGVGDVCDNCPFVPNPTQGDPDVCAPQPYATLIQADLDRFEDGLREFAEIDGPAEGLGPVFNGASCAECHSVPTVGGSNPRNETRFGRTGPGGVFDPMPGFGGSLIQERGITVGACSVSGEGVPPAATIVGRRQTTALFGLGLVDAIPDERILRYADEGDANGDGISGRPNLIGGRVGRFGWKSQVVSLHDFAGNAYLNEMGITNPDFPTESSPQGGPVTCDTVADPEDDGTNVTAFADFMTLLAPLPTGPKSRDLRLGRSVFRRLRCQVCHIDRLRTGIHPVKALHHRRARVFSDLLLHDMGPALGDGIEQGQATGTEFRTAPLWGVSQSAPYLHDGRAATLEDAIVAHAGEGQAARDAFLGLTPGERVLLLTYLNAL